VKQILTGVAMPLAFAVFAVGCWGSGDDEPKSSERTTSSATARVANGGTLITLANSAPAGSPDPQVNYTGQQWQFELVTHDPLVGFKRTAGAEGVELVPDLATEIPKPTDNGRAWTFKLRPGIKFSNGQPLTADDVRATFERLFKIGNSPNAGGWYSVIVGGDACVKAPKTCDLSDGIVVDGDSVTFHLTGGDPDFLYKLAMPFAFILPSDTPTKNVDIPPPGTGPYKWVKYAPHSEMRVERNPFFEEWSKDAQPKGRPDAIVQRFGLTVGAEVTQVERGQADWISSSSDAIPSDRLDEIGTRYADQVHINPILATQYFAFNTRVPPFDNLKARQAVNLAVDRDDLVKLAGGPNLADPTCQVLPPASRGYEPYCPYTANPDGRWTGPDMAKARQLVEESGTKGARVKVNSDTTDVNKAFGLYFVDLLNQLGYEASAQFLASDIQYPYVQNSKNKVQFAYSVWYADYPSASAFLPVLLGCESFHPNSNSSPNIAEFCDKDIDAQMSKAAATALADPDAADEIWAQVDRAVTDQAPWVAMFNPKWLDFTSKRVNGFQFHPQWGFLLAQASVQ
jgi:peptide/nickel transport system substrate-binding protein